MAFPPSDDRRDRVNFRVNERKSWERRAYRKRLRGVRLDGGRR